MSLYDLQLTDWQKLLADQPSFRPKQIWQSIHERALRPELLTSLPKELREKLAGLPELNSAFKLLHLSADDRHLTEKAIFELNDGQVIETVLMHYADRSTVCISSQAGCAMNCAFCATGQRGFYRHLSIGEIAEQVIWAISRTRITRGSKRLSNVVFMGMGEPLANTRNVFGAIRRINEDIGIGARHITVSTVGIVPGIKLFTDLGLQVNLAVSLHAANNQKRSSIVPINNRYPIEQLTKALQEYANTTNRRISFEWAMMDGINDFENDARQLIALCIPLQAHVNLIPLNPTPGWPTKGSPFEKVVGFANILDNAGVAVSIRENRGTNIDAACGQLAGTLAESKTGERLSLTNSARMNIDALLD
ncbi:MAG: 23S rRNA (adenine(2503)-C(2))-methyltransferase RlmN [Actinomycetota bacterium]|nr:MAG: 23S rRNA (adenine(2503)-C(2))-methyltransferase RlmN [Actinomycetota bacterium]